MKNILIGLFKLDDLKLIEIIFFICLNIKNHKNNKNNNFKIKL